MALVVIGNGNVCFWFLKNLGERGFLARNKVIVFAEEDVPAYDRISLSQVFEGKPLEELYFAKPEQYLAAGIELHLDDPIVEVNAAGSWVRAKSGKKVVYEKLVFATGSSSFLPPMEGRDLPHVYVYRNSRDVEQIMARAKTARSACIIGGGFLGVELAEILHKLGLRSHIIERNPGLFPRQLDQYCGQKIAGILEQKGIYVHLLRRSRRIQASGDQLILEFMDDESLSVDMIIFAVGIRPRDELAKQAGIATGPLGGITVNTYLQTSNPQVFAIGDCVHFANKVFGLVSPGYQMAEVLAACLSGDIQKFADKSSAFSQSCFGVRLSAFGQHAAGESLVYEDKTAGELIYRKIVVHEGRLLGAYGLGDWPEISRVQKSVDQKAKISNRQRQSFQKRGCLWPDETDADIRTWPETAIICNCLSLSKGYLCQLVKEGQLSAPQLIEKTRASTICGQCEPLVEQLAVTAGASPGKSPFASSGNRFGALGFLSCVALISVLVLLFWPEKPAHLSYELVEPRLKLWLKNSLYRDLTGYAAAGLSVLALIYSLRKRTRFLGTRSSLSRWYVLHAGVSLLSLGALALHTGMQKGAFVNFSLWFVFCNTVAMGSLAGLAMVLGHHLSFHSNRKLRQGLIWAHVSLFWAYPSLLVLHILSRYFYR